MPVVWKRKHGEGRVFYSSLGHVAANSTCRRCGRFSSAACSGPRASAYGIAPAGAGGDRRSEGRVMTTIHNPDPARLQPRSLDLPRRRRLLHRDLHVRMVSGRADPSLARSRELAARAAAARSRLRNSTCAASRIPAASGRRASPTPTVGSGSSTLTSSVSTAPSRTRTTPSSPRLQIEGPWSEPILRQLERLRPVAVSRRRRTQVVRQHDLEPSRPEKGPQTSGLCGIRLQEWDAGSGRLVGEPKNDLRREPPRPRRRPASQQAQRLVLSHDRRGRHGL